MSLIPAISWIDVGEVVENKKKDITEIEYSINYSINYAQLVITRNHSDVVSASSHVLSKEKILYAALPAAIDTTTLYFISATKVTNK